MSKIFLCVILMLSTTLYGQNIQLSERPVCIDNFENVSSLDKIFSSSKIILIGEAGHGDGATFELKGKLVEYLYKKHGYTIFLHEGAGFTESYQFSVGLNSSYPLSTVFDSLSYLYYSKSRELQYLRNVLDSSSGMKFYGIDCQVGNYNVFVDYLNSLPKKVNVKHIDIIGFSKYGKRVLALYNQSLGKEEFSLTLKEITEIDSITAFYIKKLINKKNSSSINTQVLLNIRAVVNMLKFNLEEMGYSYRSINYRDSVMAKNVEWIMNKYPKEKIIISAANFHVSKNMHNIIRNSDSLYYQSIYPMGWYINKLYGNKAYSIAITNSSGKQGFCTDTVTYDVVEDAKFQIDYTKLEPNLLITNCDYSFYNFKNDIQLSNQTYRSLIFGANMHLGKWSTAFDGVINIRVQKPSTLRIK